MTLSRVGRLNRTGTKGAVGLFVSTLGLLALLFGGAALAGAQSDEDTFEARFRMRGTTGEEQVRLTSGGFLLVNEQVNLTTEWATYVVEVPSSEITMSVGFSNDGLTSTGADRNVIVDWLEIAGTGIETTRIETESDDVFSKGVFNGTDCGEGYRNSAFLACNGFFEYQVGDIVNPPRPPRDFVITARGTTGTEELRLVINDDPVETITLSTSLETYNLTIPSVRLRSFLVTFDNDGLSNGVDRNVYVESAEFEDTFYLAEALTSYGTFNGVECNTSGPGATRGNNWLHCNGAFRIPTSDSPPPPDTRPTYDVVITARGTTGTERIGFEDSGRLRDVWELETVDTDRVIKVSIGDFREFRVNFRNDGRDGAGNDRNVYVSRITVDGIEYDPTTLRSKGTYDGTDCGEGFRNSNWLHCNGWFEIPGNR